MTGKTRGPGRKALVLTEVEKLDATYRGLATVVKAGFDQGQTCPVIAQAVQTIFGVGVNPTAVNNFHVVRYIPEKEVLAAKTITNKSAIVAFEGDAGLDAAALAKLWEMMDGMSAPQLLSARTLFLKIRSQNLQEQEFLYKIGQWQPEQAQDVPDQETQQKNVLRKIKEIFGLAEKTPAEATTPLLPAAVVEKKASGGPVL